MNRIYKMIHNRKGFTLIELIVVIAILGLLAAVAVPRLSGFKGEASDKANEATARTILSATSLAEAHDDAITEANVEKYVDLEVTVGTAVPSTGTGWYIRTGSPLEIYKGTTKILP